MSTRRQWATVLLCLIAAAVIVGRDVYQRLIAPAPPLNFDEAAHSLPAYYLLRDVRALDARALWGDFHIQTLWPPMHAVLKVPVFALLGPSDESARLFAFLMLVAAALMGCLVARRIKPPRPPLAALAGALFALSAPGWLFTGSWAMQETPTAFMTLATFAVYLDAQQKRARRARWYAFAGIMLVGLFLTKYNYTAFALASIGLVDLADRLRRFAQARRASRQPGALLSAMEPHTFLALFGVFALGVLGWFFTGTDVAPTEVKWRDFAFFVTNESSGYEFWSAQNLLYYVRAAAGWLHPHPIVFVLMLALAVVAVARVRHPGVALLAVFFALGFVLTTLHPLKSQRYITPIFPALWVLAGIGVGVLADGAQRARALTIAVIAAAIASWAFALPRMKPAWAGTMARDLRAAGDQIVRWQDGSRHTLIIGTFGELSPPYFEWRLRPLPAFANTPLAVNYDAPPVDGADDIERVKRWLKAHPGAQVTLIDVGESAAVNNSLDMQQKNLWKQKIVRRFAEVPGYRLVEAIDYPDSDLKVSYHLPEP